MNYLAILGRQPEFGLVELESVLGGAAVSNFGRHALITTSIDINRFGGIIKYGRIIARLPLQSIDQIDFDLVLLPAVTGKLTFGVSTYGLARPVGLGQFGLRLKRQLQARGPVRYVATRPGSNELSAAQLKYNHLPEAGFELLVATDNKQIILALTEQYQAIDAYAARDHGRPARDASVGMLPPKLAQIIVNTAGTGTIYDPFCGSGVILQEALLMGRPACGSDLSAEMVAATRTNLDWLADVTARTLPDWTVNVSDVREVNLPRAVGVASEGYLGPHLSAPPSPAALKRLQTELGKLYRDGLTHLASQLVPGSDVSICLPAWKADGYWHLPTGVVDELTELGYTSKVFQTVRSPLRYAREGQIVGRHLLLLTRL